MVLFFLKVSVFRNTNTLHYSMHMHKQYKFCILVLIANMFEEKAYTYTVYAFCIHH